MRVSARLELYIEKAGIGGLETISSRATRRDITIEAISELRLSLNTDIKDGISMLGDLLEEKAGLSQRAKGITRLEEFLT